MAEEYSHAVDGNETNDEIHPASVSTPAPSNAAPASILALDTASPRVSVAVAVDGHLAARRSGVLTRSSEELLPLVETCLEEASLALSEIEGLVALRGPGSFTGIRVGLATALGLHQALDVATTALSTLEALAAWMAPVLEADPRVDGGGEPLEALAVVDALRGEWVSQRFSVSWPPEPLEEAHRRPQDEILSELTLDGDSPLPVVGFGASRLALDPRAPRRLSLFEPEALAGPAVLLAATRSQAGSLSWDPAGLTRPLYFRPPAVTLPRSE
jgi:tRNA threonylcarbamoyl adenosine modification protein YeaZ